MAGASTSGNMSTELAKVKERARREPEGRFHALAHLIDEAALERAYGRIRAKAAVGVDGVSKEDYGQNLRQNLKGLHQRLVSGRWRHQAIRRVHLPKDDGKTRPIGISTIEDKIVQEALREVLEEVYEADFLPCSYGFRPGRSAHDAIRELTGALYREEVTVVLECDIRAYFDSLDRSKLKEMLRERIADGSLMRLIGKCLRAGVLDGAEYLEPEEGTAQGSILSPLLGNIYLHYVMDRWFETEVRPRLRGKAILCRYADDLVIGFERADDAERVFRVLPKRMAKYGLELHSEKTRLLPFGRPYRGQRRSKGPGTFDFLGFTWYWERSRQGLWQARVKTRSARRQRAVTRIGAWCKRQRHLPIKEQHEGLVRRVRGHLNYFGVNGNRRSLQGFVYAVRRVWHKWLCRRSQRAPMPWKRFEALLDRYPLPRARICVEIWGRA